MEMMVDKVSVDRCVKTLNYWVTGRHTKNEWSAVGHMLLESREQLIKG